MESLFTHKDEKEGNIGIGKLPNELHPILDDISKEYDNMIPDKNGSTFHTWYNEMPFSIKSKVYKIQNHSFWKQITRESMIINVNEMDELYYSNPQNDLYKNNLYGTVVNYGIHRDGIYNFGGITFYRVIIGLTDGNDNIITRFNNLDVGHKINKGDYIIFDFDKSSHHVIKERNELTPRILLKIHFIISEKGNSKKYVEVIKSFYLYYEFITRYITKTGTDPETYYQFFLGLGTQYFYEKNIQDIICLIILINKYVIQLHSLLHNFYSLTIIYSSIVFFYWMRYKFFGIR
jgi:hypothetical protein